MEVRKSDKKDPKNQINMLGGWMVARQGEQIEAITEKEEGKNMLQLILSASNICASKIIKKLPTLKSWTHIWLKKSKKYLKKRFS